MSKTSVSYLENNEAVALSVIEITSIPNLSIIDNNAEEAEIVKNYKKDMGNLLAEIYQNYKVQSSMSGEEKDTALEILWIAEEVENQPYKAKIKMYLLVRSIEKSSEDAVKTADAIMRACQSALELQKYEYEERSMEEMTEKIKNIEASSVKALVKEEGVENLQNQMLPFCYTYDIIQDTAQDLSRLVNILTAHPDCAVSFQLIPARLEGQEQEELSRMMQILDMLGKGTAEIGNVSFALAEKNAEVYRYYATQRNNPLFPIKTY